MTPQAGEPGRVAKLEALLARVKARAAESREPGVEAGPAPVIPPGTATRSSFPPATNAFGGLEVVDDDEVGAQLVEVEVDIDVDVDVDEPDDDEHTLTASNVAANAVDLEASPSDEPQRTPGANEVVDLAPSSSPRPIAAVADDDAFPIPRHTPPPESGKQIASAAPPAARLSSSPPSSKEGHTLIGGWQKPGVPNFGLPGVGAVRVPSPIGALPPKEAATPEGPRPQPFRPEASTQPSASQVSPYVRGAPPQVRIVPEITKPEPLAQAAKVATFEGEMPAARPQSFGDLLDASLGL